MTLNQPAGHLEPNESLIEAVIRETQEESAHTFEPTALVGIYRWQPPHSDDTYMRFCFTGKSIGHNAEQALDPDIHQALWLSYDDIIARQSACRGPLVLECLNDYRAGHRYPLTLLKN